MVLNTYHYTSTCLDEKIEIDEGIFTIIFSSLIFSRSTFPLSLRQSKKIIARKCYRGKFFILGCFVILILVKIEVQDVSTPRLEINQLIRKLQINSDALVSTLQSHFALVCSLATKVGSMGGGSGAQPAPPSQAQNLLARPKSPMLSDKIRILFSGLLRNTSMKQKCYLKFTFNRT